MLDSNYSVATVEAEAATSLMLTQLLYPLLDHPEQCSVSVLHRAESVMFVVRVAPVDMEKFVGPNIRTAKSLQIIMSAVGSKAQRRFVLSFRDDTGTGQSGTESIAGNASP